MRWLIAAGVLIGALIIGSGAGAWVRRFIGKPTRPEKIRELANPAGSFAFSLFLAVGLVAALGIGSPESLDPIPGQLINFLPKLLVAGLILLVGSTAGQLIGNTASKSLLRATGRPQPAIVRVVRLAIMGAAGILAVNQVGVNTKVIDLLVAALFFGIAASFTLMIGLGSREIASNIAAGRYLRRIVRPGDTIESAVGNGIVKEVHAVTTEIDDGDGRRLHVPHGLMLSGTIRVSSSLAGSDPSSPVSAAPAPGGGHEPAGDLPSSHES